MFNLNNLEERKVRFVESLQSILDPQDLHVNSFESKKAETNTLSVERKVIGLGFPRNLNQLQMIVKVAALFEVALYPVSQGKNIGYGEMTPTGANQFVVNLKYLNQIRSFDSINGEVLIEPGVTQKQLSEFLKQQGACFIADVTGASPDASVVGNTLEAGFGHTPIGDHRKHIVQMEVMLSDGTMMTTSEMPAIGPDLSQLFIQSNFAIVTAIRIPLLPIPEEIQTFTLAFETDKNFYDGVNILSSLRRDGTISSLIHTGNATRAFMTSSRFPEHLNKNQTLSDEECHQLLNQNSPIRFGRWSSVGGIYGYKDDVKNKRKRIEKAFKGIAKVKFFTDKKVNFIDKLLNSKLALKLASLNLVRKSFASLKAIHGIIRGQPSAHPSENIFWRVNQFEKLGLLWHAPVVPTTPDDVDLLLSSARHIFKKYQFEMPVTLTLIDQKHMTAVFNISYDRSVPEEVAKAHKAYGELNEMTSGLGYLPYRCGLVSRPQSYYNEAQYRFLQTLKDALDPQKIFAPGRYGIK